MESTRQLLLLINLDKSASSCAPEHIPEIFAVSSTLLIRAGTFQLRKPRLDDSTSDDQFDRIVALIEKLKREPTAVPWLNHGREADA